MRRRGERGQASVLLVGALLFGLAVTGLAVDGTRLFTARRDLHNVADSAALAGASAIDEAAFRASGGTELHLDPARARVVVDELLRDSGLPRGTEVSVRVDADRVEVRLRRRVRLTFLGVLGAREQTIGSHATASPNIG